MIWQAKRRRDTALYRRNRLIVVNGASVCTWCGVAISDALPPGHPQKSTADHVVPKIHGGSDRLDNLVAACWECNSRRQHRDPSVLAPKDKPDEHSRKWL